MLAIIIVVIVIIINSNISRWGTAELCLKYKGNTAKAKPG